MKRGEVWLVNLDPTVGAEIRKTRPAVLVSSDMVGILPLRVIVPITEWKDRYGMAPWMVRIEPTPANGLAKTSAADCFQIRSISTGRLVRKVGQVAAEEMDRIVEGIKLVIEA
jgi:mRNA interferase MazF